MCRTIGVTSDDIQISDDEDFIENGFKVDDYESYYTNGKTSVGLRAGA
jgi:hypothetical protein